jgi:ketosteroid isomerase-like protein
MINGYTLKLRSFLAAGLMGTVVCASSVPAQATPQTTGSPRVMIRPMAPRMPSGPAPQADVSATASVTLPGKTSGPQVAAARAKIQTLYNKQNAGIAKEDIKQAMSIYAPDMVKTHINGQQSERDHQKFFISRIFARLKRLHAQTTIRKFSLEGGTAHVIERQHWAGRGMSGPLKKEVWTYVDFITKDDWKKQPNGGWMIVSTTNLRRVKYAPDRPVHVNGKTLPANAPDDTHPAPAPSDADIDAVQ